MGETNDKSLGFGARAFKAHADASRQRSAELVAGMRDERLKNEPEQIVSEFEDTFGRLTATERTWLRDRIRDSQIYARRR